MPTLADYLKKQGLKPTAVVRTSNQLETKQAEDYGLYLKRRQKRLKGEDKSYAELEMAKPRSGRGLSQKQMDAALAGTEMPRKVRSKFVRAVNTLLAGKATVDSATLFGKGPTPKGTGKKSESEEKSE